MAKSKARFLAEILGSDGKVQKGKSKGFEQIALTDLPTITNAKLQNSAVTFAGETASLGGSASLDTGDITEHTNFKYFTDARSRGSISASLLSGHGAVSYNASTGALSITGVSTEAIQDVVGAMFSSNTESGITVTYDDSDGTIDLSVGALNTGNVSEGSNLYHTTARARAAISATGSLSYNSTTGVMSFTMPAQNTSNITEGSNLYHTTARARAAISASGDLSYNSSTGVVSFSASGAPVVSVNSVTGSVVLDSGDIAESGNLYFTNARAQSAITGSALNMGSNNITTTGKMLYSNLYSATGDLPSASTYHGMFAHVHGTGKGYFAHAGNWIELANQSDLTTTNTTASAALPKAGGTMTGALNMGSYNITTTGKMLYANVYNSTGDLPSASTYHGMFAHVHGTGKGYFAHAGNWIELANQSDVNAKAALASPTLTGTPLAPTAAANTNTTQIATTAYVQTELTDLIDGAPGTLDTLNELAAAINDDANYNSTLTTALATKVNKTSNQALGNTANAMTISGNTITLARGDSTTDTVTVPDTNTTYSVGDGGLTQKNFTTTLKSKLDGIEASATADQTAAQILTAIKTVDGSGSGLDTDLFDGQDSARFFKSFSSSAPSAWERNNANFSVRGGDSSNVGLHMEQSNGNFGFQLYGTNGTYGFLDNEWGGWDIQKVFNSTFKVDEGSGLKRVLNEANWTTYITVGDGGLTTKNFTAALKTKLDGIATGATNTAIPHYTSAIAVGDGGLTTKDFTVALKNKLDGIAAGATNTSAITNNNQLTNGAGYITASNAAVTNKLPLVTGVTAMHNTQGTQNSANAVLRTQVNGYSMLGWINTTSGATSSTLTRIYCSEDGYIRYQTPANFGTSISPHINFTTIANNKILPTSGNYTWTASTLASAYSPVGIATSFVRSANGWPEYGTVLHVGGRGGSDAGGDFQLFSGHGAANGGNYLRVRNADNSASPSDAWTAFRTIWDSGNDGSGSGLDADTVDGIQGASLLRSDAADSFSGTLTMGTQKALVPNDYGRGVYGLYSSYKHQHVWSMGTAYNLADNGSGVGNLYGISYTHTNVGTGYGSNSATGLGHQLNGRANGTLQWALGEGIWSAVTGNVWGASNDGSGSGLDADLLDGLNSTSFLRSDADDAYDGTLTMNGMQFRSSNVNRNLKIQGTSGGTDVGISGFRSDGTHGFQMYADGTNYGFLDGNWASWDIQKAKNGAFKVDEGSGLKRVLNEANWTTYITLPTNADTIDGRGFVNTGSNSAQNSDTINSNGISYYTSGVTNFSGNSTDGALYSQQYSSSWQHQIAGDYRSGQIAVRGKNNGTFQAWRKVWDEGNDGSGSGLDADLLDGKDSLSYVSTHNGTSRTIQAEVGALHFYGDGVNSGQTAHSYAIFQEAGAWSSPYPDLRIAYHTGIKIGGHSSYNGTRFYNNSDMATELFSVGNGDNHVRVAYNLFRGGNTVWDAGNDGAGSGLDADLLDGVQLANINRGTNTSGVFPGASGYDLNSVFTATPRAGFIDAWSGSNFPPGTSHIQGIQVRHATSTHYGWQLFGQYNQQGKLYHRQVSNNSWGSWSQLWNSNNDGSGSGLDADTLDGQHGSNYIGKNGGSYYQPNTWIDFGATNEGLYWSGGTAAGHHIYPDGQIYMRFRSGNGTQGGLKLQNSSATTYGHVYANSSNYIGFLDNGASWLFQARSNGQLYQGNGNGLIWHAANDGSGSGLDADLLDGMNAAGGGGSIIMKTESNGYSQLQNWTNVADAGLYSSNTNGAHWYPNTAGSYGTWRMNGSRGGYSGIYHNNGGGVVGGMFDSSGNGGDYNSTSSWHYYYHRSNDCIGLSGSTTSSSYGAYVNGALYATGDVVGSSDRRLKKNINTIENGLAKVEKLRGVTYEWKDAKESGSDGNNVTPERMGVIAQEIIDIVPEVVTHDKENDRYGVSYGHLTGVLIEAIKELSDKVKELEKKLEEK